MIYKIEKLEKDIKNGDYNYIPKASGVYRVLNLDNMPIKFLNKAKNTNFNEYEVDFLSQKYSKSVQSKVLYIGKGENLHKRIKQYIKYGLNLAKNHKGGRAIFQIENYNELYIEIILTDRCECAEKGMLVGFNQQYGELPVANMKS